MPVQKLARPPIDTGNTFKEYMSEQDSTYNFLYTINATVGTPAQSTQLLISINSLQTTFFDEVIGVTEKGAGFYNPRNSSRAEKLGLRTLPVPSDGFSFSAYRFQDDVCISSSQPVCVHGFNFYNAVKITANDFLSAYNLSNIGGILGL